MVSVPRDRLRDLVDILVESLDEGGDTGRLAAELSMSRHFFDRQVSAGLHEPPATFRRRLLLERAAWQLQHGKSVTDAALEAGYGSIEAFSRAFNQAYGIAPSRFTREARDFRMDAPNGIHFHPPAGLWLGGEEGPPMMDLSDRLATHDHALTAFLIEKASTLTDEQLDRPIRPGHQVLCFEGPEPDVRTMIDRLIWAKEVWCSAIGGREFPKTPDRSINGMRARLEIAGEQFVALVRRVRDQGAWDQVFVDALCDPPESFSLGGVIAHILTFSAHRRQVLIGALEELGVKVNDSGCPLDWEKKHAR
jgi:AraC family transcriptional regulator